MRKTTTAISSFLMLCSTSSLHAQEPVEPQSLRIDILRSQLDQPVDNIVTGSVLKENELLNYCYHISDVATEARNSVLKKKLEEVETRVAEKLDQLAVRINTMKKWSAKREEFLESANDSLVQIFQSMRPDAAASQLTELGPGIAASIIAKLEPKYSSAILAEMKPQDAAKITMVLTSALEVDETKTN